MWHVAKHIEDSLKNICGGHYFSKLCCNSLLSLCKHQKTWKWTWKWINFKVGVRKIWLTIPNIEFMCTNNNLIDCQALRKLRTILIIFLLQYFSFFLFTFFIFFFFNSSLFKIAFLWFFFFLFIPFNIFYMGILAFSIFFYLIPTNFIIFIW